MPLLFAPPPNTTIRDTWRGMTISGKPVGYCHETVAKTASGHVSMVVETRLSIGRLSAKVEMFTKTTCMASNSGALISCQSQVKLSKQESLTTARMKAGQIVVTTMTGGRPDVVLMDLQMPGLDGIGAIQALKKTDPAVKVLVLTTYAGDEDLRRPVSVGAKGVLAKSLKSQGSAQGTPGFAIRTLGCRR